MLFSFPVLLRVLGSVGDNLIGLTPLRFSLWVGSSNAQGGISPELLEPKWDLGPFRNCWVAEPMEARLGRGLGVGLLKANQRPLSHRRISACSCFLILLLHYHCSFFSLFNCFVWVYAALKQRERRCLLVSAHALYNLAEAPRTSSHEAMVSSTWSWAQQSSCLKENLVKDKAVQEIWLLADPTPAL